MSEQTTQNPMSEREQYNPDDFVSTVGYDVAFHVTMTGYGEPVTAQEFAQAALHKFGANATEANCRVTLTNITGPTPLPTDVEFAREAKARMEAYKELERLVNEAESGRGEPEGEATA